jgi:hypothetical protein
MFFFLEKKNIQKFKASYYFAEITRLSSQRYDHVPVKNRASIASTHSLSKKATLNITLPRFTSFFGTPFESLKIFTQNLMRPTTIGA